jgi:uncharacterized protein YpmS
MSSGTKDDPEERERWHWLVVVLLALLAWSVVWAVLYVALRLTEG